MKGGERRRWNNGQRAIIPVYNEIQFDGRIGIIVYVSTYVLNLIHFPLELSSL